MPRDGAATKRRIIEVAYGLFYKGSIARTSIDEVAGAAGITKRSFYYHFDSKDALIAAVMAVQGELVLARTRSWLDRASGSPQTLIETLFREYAAWVEQPRWRGSGFTRAVMEFADSPGHPARIAARRHKAAVEDLLADTFAQYQLDAPRDFARRLMLLIEGCNSILMMHGDTSYVHAACEAARVLLREHSGEKLSLPERRKSYRRQI